MSPPKKTRGWCFTQNWPKPWSAAKVESMQRTLERIPCVYMVMQKEETPTTGRNHIQVRNVLKLRCANLHAHLFRTKTGLPVFQEPAHTSGSEASVPLQPASGIVDRNANAEQGILYENRYAYPRDQRVRVHERGDAGSWPPDGRGRSMKK